MRIVSTLQTLEVLTLKYFEKGNTFMSADSFHHAVEKSMQKMNKIVNFQDFSDCISANGIAVEMSPNDFFDFKNHLSRLAKM